MMSVIAVLALFAGLVLAGLGLVLPDRVRAPWDGLIAFLTPVGVASAIVGVLLLCVPDFFSAEPTSGTPSVHGAGTAQSSGAAGSAAGASQHGAEPSSGTASSPTSR